MTEPPLTFLASIAPLQSAITIASDGGARVKIDLPESEMPAIVRLMLFRGMVIRVTIEAVPERPAARKRKPGRAEPEWGDDGDEETDTDDDTG
jgi:hypothetical protein